MTPAIEEKSTSGVLPTKVFVLIKGLDVGGAEKLLVLMAPHWDRRNFTYEVGYLVTRQDALALELERNGIPVFCLGQGRFYDPRLIVRLARLLRRHRVDILHAHLPYPGVIGRIAGRLAGVKGIVYTEHSPVERYHPISRRANHLTYSWNDTVIAVSNEVRSSIMASYHVNGQPKVRTIYNGIGRPPGGTKRSGLDERREVYEELGIPCGHKVVISVANLRPEKGHLLLLQAARQILQEDRQVTFLLVGQGEMEEALRAEALHLDLGGNLVLAGHRTDVFRLLRASDLFILPSDYEGLPVSLLEAMAVGLPAVCTRVGGVPEVITHGVHGLLVVPGDPLALASSVLRLLRDGDLRRRMGRAGADRIAWQFTVESMVAQTEDLYRELVVSG